MNKSPELRNPREILERKHSSALYNEASIPSGMALGSAVHEALAAYHRRLQTGQNTRIDQIQSTFIAAWQEQVSERPVQYREGEQPPHQCQANAEYTLELLH